MLCMAACGTDRANLAASFGSQDDARLVDEAIALGETERVAARQLPNYPLECRRRVRSGVKRGEPLDTAVERSDIALGLANARMAACAAWYEKLAEGRS